MSLLPAERVFQGDVKDADGRTVVVGGLVDTDFRTGATSAAPAAGTSIIPSFTPAKGVYDIELVTMELGTPDANPQNIEFRVGGGPLAFVPSVATAFPTRIKRKTFDGVTPILVRVGGSAGGAGAIYFAQLKMEQISA